MKNVLKLLTSNNFCTIIKVVTKNIVYSNWRERETMTTINYASVNIARNFATAVRDKLDNGSGENFYVLPGRKFDKIVHEAADCRSRGVYAFVERSNGNLIKASSWVAPQKDTHGLAIRYNLATEAGFEEALRNADRHGAFLYASHIKL